MASPPMGANSCGFFGSAETKNMCSKCYRDTGLKEAQVNLAKLVIVEKTELSPTLPPPTTTTSTIPESSVKKNRCLSCNKKVGLLGFECRCGNTFCSVHRYPEKHECSFDFKTLGQNLIAKANPLVKADKFGTRMTKFVVITK